MCGKVIDQLFDNNKNWTQKWLEKDPEHFLKISQGQQPKFLWIGCSDSRVPAEDIVGLQPGELFVHRNIANLVLHTDLNCQSVLQFAINVLKVEHIIICGHYECGGVKASMSSPTGEILDNWLKKIRDVYFEHRVELNLMNDPAKRADRLVELNVTHQVRSVGHTVSAQNAWKEGRKLSIHGFVYNIREGKLIDLECSISGPEQITSIYRVHKES